MTEVTGSVDSVIFQSSDSGYCVCDIEADNGELITAVGIMPYLTAGDRVKVYGNYVTHQVYGRQLKVEKYEKLIPKGKDEMLKYLSSGAIKGIGPKIAEKIVEQYGDESFNVISDHPEWLVQIRGISRKKAFEMSEDFKEKAGVREILDFCKDTIPTATVMRIYKKWGRNALNMIRENPYRLCSDFYGISFKRADQMAQSVGIEPESEERIKCAIQYSLGVFSSRDGHTYVKADKLCSAAASLIGVDESRVQKKLLSMGKGDGICLVNREDGVQVYKKTSYDAEKYIARKLLVLENRAIRTDIENVYSLVETIEAECGIQYAKMQRKAIEASLLYGVSVITGGPGTGKTTVIKALIRIFEKIGMRYALCAPTGRASKRMSEATSCEAKTIHRLLEMTSSQDGEDEAVFMRNDKNLLKEDVIIVDEASMIDVPLMDSFLRAIKPGARLILIGDVNQLPSVGEGNVLKDVINSECFCVTFLNEIFRQSENSGIVVNAHLINNGKYPDLTAKSDDFFFVSKDEGDIPSYIAELCATRIPKKFSKTVFDGIQIITPSKKGVCGTVNLNSFFQGRLNPSSPKKSEITTSAGRTFRTGDKVMQIRNDYDIEWERYGEDGTGIFNGEIGVIEEADSDEGILVNFDGKKVRYETSMLEELEHAYAITVHKSQGSEYPIVIIPLSQYAPMLLTRNLLYTAITRAENMVIVIGKKEIFYRMIDNNEQVRRNTGLEAFLRQENETIRNN